MDEEPVDYTYICAYCGGSYTEAEAAPEGGDERYCSRECWLAAEEEAAEQAQHQAARDRDQEPHRWPREGD